MVSRCNLANGQRTVTSLPRATVRKWTETVVALQIFLPREISGRGQMLKVRGAPAPRAPPSYAPTRLSIPVQVLARDI